MLTSTSRSIRTLFLLAVSALFFGLVVPIAPASAAGPITGINPTISGTPIQGNTLTANAGPTTPPGATFTYQWQTTAPTTDIAGATSQTFVLTSAQLGKQVQVVVTAHKSGKDDTAATSAPTAVVQGVFTAPPVVGIDDTTPVVDAPITASVTTDSTPAADSYTFQWYADGTLISGATNAAYTPTADDVTKVLTAKATPVKTNYVSSSGVGTSAATDPVAKADFTTAPTASITGTAQVDQVLTANASGESPAGSGYTYQWKADDTDVSGATSSTFTPSADEVGKAITVVVTATKAGYNDSSDTSDATSAVIKANFSTDPQVSIDDTTPEVDQEVSAVVDTDSVPAGTYAYQWYTVDGANPAVEISGATDDSYTATVGDLGKTLQVRVTVSKPGYNDASDTSAETSAVAKGDFAANPTVTITGTAKEGQTLTANAANELPTGDSYTYQWAADGIDISGANSSTFTPTAVQVGKAITVTVVAKKAGYNDSNPVTSLPTAPVDPAILSSFTTGPTVNLSSTTPKVGDILTANPSGEVPAADSYAYQWYRISATNVKTAMDGETGKTYTVTAGNLNYKLQVKVTAIKFGYNNKSASSVQTDRVNQIILSKTTVARGQSLGVTAKHLRSGQVYRIFIDGVTVYKGTVPSTGTVSRTVTVPTSIGIGSKRVWVSGYDKAGVRDFLVLTTIPVT